MSMLSDFSQEDVERLLGWIDSPAMLGHWAGPAFTYPLTRTQLLEHLRRCAERGDHMIYKALDPDGADVVGHAELAITSRQHGTASIGRVLIGPEYRGRGFGTRLMNALLETAFDRLDMHRVELGVFDVNAAALACYESVGFRREGLRRETYRGPNAYWSTVVMGILAPEWRAVHGSRA